jgi:non-ribosomal peptide synthetase component F
MQVNGPEDLCAGASVHVAPDEVRTSPWEFSDWIADRRLTAAFLPTSTAAAYLRHSSRFGQLRCVLTGGEQLVLDNGHPLRLLVNHYGPTEATVVTTRAAVEPDRVGAAPMGRPIPSARLRVVGEDRRPVPAGGAHLRWTPCPDSATRPTAGRLPAGHVRPGAR